ncbi:MAG: hypothetical protein JWN14_3414 [Chthonomonadales bacterium]|nr:hypothetical protein [Chthonomonadales bacterium]
MKKRLNGGFTLVEIVVVLFVVCLLMAIVLPVYLSAKRHGEDATCLSELRQTSLALSLYISDYDSYYPSVISATFRNNHTESDQTWRDMLVPYFKTRSFSRCPIAFPSSSMVTNVRQIDICGYAYNQLLSRHSRTKTSKEYFGQNESYVVYPSLTVSIFDARPGILALRKPDTARIPDEMRGIWRTDIINDIMSLAPGASRHHGGANYVFADGHAKWLQPEQISSLDQSDGVRPGFGL